MANLFFVHTPMQMVVAQQVIHQEGLEHNLLLYGYVDDNRHFLDTYELLKIDKLWEDSILFENLAACVDLTLRRPIRCFRDVLRNLKRINLIIENNKVDNIYLGDIDNIGYQCLMYYYKNKCTINIYEEGSSHYFYNKRQAYNRRFQRMQVFLLDYLFYKPFLGFKFANYWYRNGDYEHLPIDCRYSIIPGLHNEVYDKSLKIDTDFQSSQLKDYLKDEIAKIEGGDKVFLITSIVYEHQNKQYRRERYSAYLEVIDNYIKTIPSNTAVILKLHPRETKSVEQDITELIKKHGLKVVSLSKQITIPIEIYLQIMKPSAITMFWNSSTMYNGFLYPQCEIKDLMPEFFHVCDSRGYNTEDKMAFRALYS